MPSQRLWQQVREVNVGGKKFRQDGHEDDLDMKIEIGSSKDGKAANFTVTLWNLAKDTWSQVNKGDTCEIKLGWGQTGPAPKIILTGIVNQRFTQTEEQDRKYILKGKDKASQRLKVKFSHTWKNQTPDAIAKHIANEIDLGIGKFDSVGEPIEGMWAVKKDKPAKYWLKQLLKEAEKRTNEKWGYFVQTSKLYFLKKSSNIQTAININSKNAITVDTARGKTDKSSEENEIEFEAYLDPRLRQGGLINVDSTDVSGVFQVSTCDFSSSTTNGDHLMSGTAVDKSAEYEVVYPGTERGKVRAYRQTP